MYKIAAFLLAAGLVLLVASAISWPVRSGQSEVAPQAAAEPTRPTAELAQTGRALFAAKGCVSCHRHDGFRETQEGYLPDAPNLTHYQPDAAFVRTWLRDPAAVRPGTAMPNLELSEAEIEALIAFLASAEPAAQP
jgi:mono/diheme cytochrome c family protein